MMTELWNWHENLSLYDKLESIRIKYKLCSVVPMEYQQSGACIMLIKALIIYEPLP